MKNEKIPFSNGQISNISRKLKFNIPNHYLDSILQMGYLIKFIF